jgi:hypothetical protein
MAKNIIVRELFFLNNNTNNEMIVREIFVISDIRLLKFCNFSSLIIILRNFVKLKKYSIDFIKANTTTIIRDMTK